MIEYATSSLELLLDLSDRSEATKVGRLQGALRDAIREGRLPAGQRLPSSRSLATDLGVARNVVVDAYDQLKAEGYLDARHGSGTHVAARATTLPATAAPTGQSTTRWAVDFQPGKPDLGAFPRNLWRTALKDAVDHCPDSDLDYGDPRGAEALRAELADYLRRVRGADLDPENIVITSGITPGLGLIGRALKASGNGRIAIEDPCGYNQRRALASSGVELIEIPVDAEGIRSAEVAERAHDADAVVVTPAHQYPTGAVLSPERRMELIAWARSKPGRFIIEDDYDAEYRYDRQAIGTMQGLAPDVVVLAGSVSKTLAPGLRMAWFGLPGNVGGVVARQMGEESGGPGIFPQLALANLLNSGAYDRIIRKGKARTAERRDLVRNELAKISEVTVSGVDAGLHLLVNLPEGTDEMALVTRLAERSVRVPPLSRYRAAPGPPGLVLSYGHLSEHQIVTGVAALCEALGAEL